MSNVSIFFLFFLKSNFQIGSIFGLSTSDVIDHDINGHDVLVFVYNQPDTQYHSVRLSAFRRHIVSQLPANQPPKLIISTNDTLTVQQHMILPALFEFRDEVKTFKWILFVQEETRLQLKELYHMLSEVDYNQPELLGSAMKDFERSIIHHFDKPFAVHYPHREVGFAMSISLANMIIKKLELESSRPEKYDTHIDPQYEMVKFIRDKLLPGFQMVNSTEFCLSTEPTEHCVSWLTEHALLPDCGGQIGDDEFVVAVKTCKKFFHSRIPIIKSVWANEVKNIVYFAELHDPRIPTISTGVPNTETGHCAKMQKIIELLATDPKWASVKFAIIVDDDTLLSVARLKQLLYCYRHDTRLALGERYTYMSWFGSGYDYPTGGSGTILSLSVLRSLVSGDHCFCSSPDWPDDMTLGLWLDAAQVPLRHCGLLHQAGPHDYSWQRRLLTEAAVSYHKLGPGSEASTPSMEPALAIRRCYLDPSRPPPLDPLFLDPLDSLAEGAAGGGLYGSEHEHQQDEEDDDDYLFAKEEL